MSHRVAASAAVRAAAAVVARVPPRRPLPPAAVLTPTSSRDYQPSSWSSPPSFYSNLTARSYHHDSENGCSLSRPICRNISSTSRLHDDNSAELEVAAADGPTDGANATTADPLTEATEDDDPCPPWQNPLHHNHPELTKVFKEDFAPGEEMPIVPLPPFEVEGEEGKVLASPHLHELADEIVRLNMLEVKELVDRMGAHFGFDDDDGGFGDGGRDDDGDGGSSVEEEAVVEKTAFDLKLSGFDAKGKIKVIKEVRAVTGLGLKEAKELVEGAPTIIKKDIKKEEAEELKKKLEEVGATIEIV